MASSSLPSAVTTGLVVVSAIFPALSAVALYLRVVAVRQKASTGSRSDEIWLLVSWLTTAPLSLVVWVVAARSGINYYKINNETGVKYSLALIWLCSVILNAPETAVKIAILLFYRRIFSTPMFKVCVRFGIATISVWGIVFFCYQSHGRASVGLPYDATALGLAQVGTNIALDVIVLCFPLPVISRLHMPTNRKMAVALIFWLGVLFLLCRLGCAASSLEKVPGRNNRRSSPTYL
ncbi:hypothetical protein MAA_11772 [Metarhizium robertsii ARSEF 23]|uniref:Rhodopsin domain-containing protein n=1 Tax=Metarhizium robertsii (strain ARSEF 23 / ATCC MYA-3075) TaxID=655844 RepID=A0A0B2XFE2_METRA|nr:uncharacterized protein MAA_11772 [Metarhizium robertsii ARSEF 23]KHO10626.1 hypothetical protein MAA_11772 [Metarhizium robertsii ARSEF 23]